MKIFPFICFYLGIPRRPILLTILILRSPESRIRRIVYWGRILDSFLITGPILSLTAVKIYAIYEIFRDLMGFYGIFFWKSIWEF